MDAPCGGVERGDNPTVYEAGSTVDVSWVLTQNHFNQFRVAFSPGDDLGFDDNVIGTLPDETSVFEYTQAVPLPACTCEACTLQLVQFTATGNLGYYSCADIELVAPEGEDLPVCAAAEPGGSSSSGGAPSETSSTSGEVGDTSSTTAEASTSAAPSSTDPSTGTSGSPPEGTGETSSGPPASQAESDGCGCRTGHRDPRWLWMLLAAGLGWRRRRPAA